MAKMATLRKSRGHVTFWQGSEFFHGPDGTLYMAPWRNPLDTDGYRQGARFESQPRADGHKAYLRDAYEITIRSRKTTR